MTTVLATPRTARRQWGLPHYLALLGLPLLALHLWTTVAYLSDSPHQVTKYREDGTLGLYAARAAELSVVVIGIGVFIYLFRSCRQRRELTVEAMAGLLLATFLFYDGFNNFFGPTILYSSNLINLNLQCGNMPFVVNPDCGSGPDPVLLFFFAAPIASVMACVVGSRVRGWAQHRWPGISTARQIALIFAVCLLVNLPTEIFFVATGIYTFVAPDVISIPLGEGKRLALTEPLAAVLWLGTIAVLFAFRDDRGRTVLERGLDHHGRRTQKAITMLALYSVLGWLTVIAAVPMWAYGPYEPAWPKLPRHLVNDACDAPGFSGTRYGPCPGSPGYRMPGRTSF